MICDDGDDVVVAVVFVIVVIINMNDVRMVCYERQCKQQCSRIKLLKLLINGNYCSSHYYIRSATEYQVGGWMLLLLPGSTKGRVYPIYEYTIWRIGCGWEGGTEMMHFTEMKHLTVLLEFFMKSRGEERRGTLWYQDSLYFIYE